MRSYLSLIPIFSRVHRRQNRMTLMCIIISVFLVTTVFSVADMSVQAETIRMMNRHGSWHIQIEDISEKNAGKISRRSDVAAASWYQVINYDASEKYFIGKKKAALYGTDEVYMNKMMRGISEGAYPRGKHEVMLSTNAKDTLNLRIGDDVTINTPSGSISCTVSGFGEDDSVMYRGQRYLIGVYMTRTAFLEILDTNSVKDSKTSYFVQFKKQTNISEAIKDIRELYGLTDEVLSENTGLLGMSGASSNSTMQNVYAIAMVLFVLVGIAGILMISGSMNSNITQRIRFFGMMRCIGASKRQIIRFVRLEALNWCRLAVPIGIAFSILITWAICAVLRFGIGGEFSDMPLFGWSAPGVISGVVIGIATVLLAAQSPAKRAAGVSPMKAVSGGAESTQSSGHAAVGRYLKIETSLGIHHAVSAKKNLILMTGSFAFTIILILCFSVGLDFAQALLPSLRTWQPDLTITSYGNACSLDRKIVKKIRKMPGVKQVYGNAYIGNLPASSDENTMDHAGLVSYDKYMLDCANNSMVSGDLSKVYGDSGYVLTITHKDNLIKVGDKIQLEGGEVEAAGILSDGLFSNETILICSEDTFARLAGKRDYAMISVQLADSETDEIVNKISAFAGKNDIFTDMRDNNRESNATYWAVRLLIYSFLVIIGMITVLYIMNSISMSVSARIKQYGAMCAVGMDGRQLTKMIAAEAFTYAIAGCVVGCALGLPLSGFIYSRLITRYFGIAWKIPVLLLAVILLVMLVVTAAAVYAPSRRIRNMAVTDTLNEL